MKLQKLPLLTVLAMGLCLLSIHIAQGQTDNTTFGVGAGSSITTGDFNTFIGVNAGNSTTSGSQNVFIGADAGLNYVNDIGNIGIGYRALGGVSASPTGDDNIAIGSLTLQNVTSGTDNTVVGDEAGRELTTGNDNVFIGRYAGRDATTATDNTAVGEQAGLNLETGGDNTFIGNEAGYNNTDGDDNTFLGQTAGRSNTTGNNNTFVGTEAGYDCTSGYRNTAVGDSAGIDISVGFDNTFVGQGAGSATEHADGNTFVGRHAGRRNNISNGTTNANYNTFVGYMTGDANEEGAQNVAIGYNADFVADGTDNSILIGANASFSGTIDRNYAVIIGADATGACSNCMVLGGTSPSTRVSVGIGTTNPNSDASLELAETDKGFLINRLSNAERSSLGSGLSTADEGMMVYDTEDQALYTWNGTQWVGMDSQDLSLSSNTLSLTGDASGVDLSAYLDNTDAQNLSRSGNMISITGGNTINLPDSSKWSENGSAVYYDGGNVGIGTTAPAARLHVTNGDVLLENNRFVTVTRSDDGFSHQVFGMDANNDILLNRSAIVHGRISRTVIAFNARSFDVRNQNNQTLLRIDADGNMGVGQVSPSYTVDINGDGRINTDWVVSDKRYKKNIRELSGVIEKIQALRGVRFQYQTEAFKEKNFSDGSNYGFIAQELKAVIPELVSVDKEGYYAVNYDGLIPLLTEAIKQQQETLQQQQEEINKIAVLESENATIKAALNALKEMLAGLDHTRDNSTKTEQDRSETINGTTAPDVEKAFLYQNEPNPFREKTIIRYKVPDRVRHASIVIYNLKGEALRVFEGLNKGKSHVEFNGGSMQAGTYIYSLVADGKEVDTRRMVLTQ